MSFSWETAALPAPAISYSSFSWETAAPAISYSSFSAKDVSDAYIDNVSSATYHSNLFQQILDQIKVVLENVEDF